MSKHRWFLAAVILTCVGGCLGLLQSIPTTLVLDAASSPLSAGTDVVADGPTRLDVKGVDRDFAVLVAPEPGATGPAMATVNSSAPFVSISIGWAYLTGESPAVRTRRVSAASEGTHFIVQTNSSADRVYLRSVKGTESITVQLLSDTGDVLDTKSWVATQDMYVEAGAKSALLTDPLPVPTKPGDPIADFYAAALQTADDAGLGP